MNAALSPCGTYRYALWRQLQRQLEPRVSEQGETALFVMLNPSTADDLEDDPTIRRCLGFVRREGFARLAVANLYALRSTNPARLATHPDPIGPVNDEWLKILAGDASTIVVAWGASRHAAPGRIETVLRLLGGRPLKCLGLSDGGHPRHPLMVRADQPFVDYRLTSRDRIERQRDHGGSEAVSSARAAADAPSPTPAVTVR